MTKPKPHFPPSVPKSAIKVLMDRDTLVALLREHPSQKSVGEFLGTTTEMLKRAREYHDIPARPPNLPPAPDLKGMAPRAVLADPELTEVLMVRAYTRAGTCPPWCRYWGQKMCPKPGQDYDAPDQPDDIPVGAMHPMCPLGFYLGSDEPILLNGGHPMFHTVIIESPEEEVEPGREERKRKETERNPETPESFLQFLQEIKGGL